MTEPKYQRMGKLEKFYIEQNWKQLSIDQLSTDTNVLKKSIAKFIDKLKVEEDKSQEEQKLTQSKSPVTSALDASKMMSPRKGVAIMSKASSEISDEIRKLKRNIPNANCITTTREV